MIPDLFICPCPPDPHGECATPEQCLARRQDNWNDYREVCRAMRVLREMRHQ